MGNTACPSPVDAAAAAFRVLLPRCLAMVGCSSAVCPTQGGYLYQIETYVQVCIFISL